MKRFVFLLCVSRATTLALLSAEIEAVVTGRRAYDSWLGALCMGLAGAAWGVGDLLAHQISRKEHGDE